MFQYSCQLRENHFQLPIRRSFAYCTPNFGIRSTRRGVQKCKPHMELSQLTLHRLRLQHLCFMYTSVSEVFFHAAIYKSSPQPPIQMHSPNRVELGFHELLHTPKATPTNHSLAQLNMVVVGVSRHLTYIKSRESARRQPLPLLRFHAFQLLPITPEIGISLSFIHKTHLRH